MSIQPIYFRDVLFAYRDIHYLQIYKASPTFDRERRYKVRSRV